MKKYAHISQVSLAGTFARLAFFAVALALFGTQASAQALIRFPPNQQATRVETVSAMPNGEFQLRSSLGRVRLAGDLSVRAISREFADIALTSIAVGDERIEIGRLSDVYGFSGISRGFEFGDFSDTSQRGCTVRRFRADESVRWYQWIRGASCTTLAASENGEIWLTSSVDVLTLRADGTLKRQMVSPLVSNLKITGITPAVGSNLGGAFIRYELISPPQVNNSANTTASAVAFVDATGIERWRFQTAGSAPNVRALADGGAEIAGNVVQVLNPTGVLTAERVTPIIAGVFVAQAFDVQSGERWILTRGDCALTGLSATGAIEWRTALPCGASVGLDSNQINFEPARPIILTGQSSVAVIGRDHIVVLNKIGAVLVNQSIRDQGVSAAALNPQGTQLLYVASGAQSDFASYKALRQISVPNQLDQSVSLPLSSDFNSPLSASVSAPNGTTFAITSSSETRTTNSSDTLTAIGVNGQVLWQKPLTFTGYFENLIGGSKRMVCVTHSSVRDFEGGVSSLVCWAARTGELLFELNKPLGYFPNDRLAGDSISSSSMRVFDDKVLIARPRSSRPDTVLSGLALENYEAISSSGNQLFAFDLPGGMSEFAWSEKGLIAFAGSIRTISFSQIVSNVFTPGVDDFDSVLTTWNATGRQLGTTRFPFAQSEVAGAGVLSGGTLIAKRDGTRVASSDPRAFGPILVPGTLSYEFIDLAGNVKWRQPGTAFDTGLSGLEFSQQLSPIVPAISRTELKEDTREVQPMLYVLRSFDNYDQAFAPRRSVLQKINLDTGALMWRRSINIDPVVSGGLKPPQAIELPSEMVNGQWQVFVHGRSVNGAEFVESLDASSGNLLDIALIGDVFPSSAIVTAGDVRFVARTPLPVARSGAALGAPWQVGAWYNPATPGQGFFIERIGNTQFMAWFHSDWDLPGVGVSHLLSPARQRWLSLQGEVAPGAIQAELKIYQSSGGSLAEGGASAPVEIGTATLRFLSCDSAILSYELPAERCTSQSCIANQRRFGMLHGVIPLRALAPASGCGTPLSLPAPISAKTGLFHDPSVRGQGLMTIANAGTFFAGWFARDPSNAADDPDKQAWFTLQAPLPSSSTETNGNVVRAKIYRTLGGRRDVKLPTVSQEVGEATITFSGCDRLSMQYQFGSSDEVKPFQNLAGQINLVRIGVCR